MHNTQILGRAELLSHLDSCYRLMESKTSNGNFRFGFVLHF